MSEAATTTEFKFATDELWVDSILTQSVQIDWQEAAGEYGEGFVSYEAPTTEDGGYASYDSDEGVWRDEDGNEVDPYEDDSLTGPMMNYHYPLGEDGVRRIGGPNEAADAIKDLPLAVIEFEDGGYSLALTGGGMDLSWEIVEAFIRLGWSPPYRFASDLPRLAGHQPKPEVLAAARRSLEILRGWSVRGLERLTEEWSA